MLWIGPNITQRDPAQSLGGRLSRPSTNVIQFQLASLRSFTGPLQEDNSQRQASREGALSWLHLPKPDKTNLLVKG